MANNKYQELKDRMQEIYDLQHINALLAWDQATYMPSGGAAARGRQMAIMARLAQEKLIEPAVGKLLDDLQPYAESLPYDSVEASLVRVARRDYEKALKVPPQFLAEFYDHMAESYQVWTVARPANDFKAVQPYLEKTLDFSRQYADYFGNYDHIADPLIDDADNGMKAASIRALFAELRSRLVPIAQAITEQTPADDTCVHQFYPEAKQLDFSLEIIKRLGYDFDRGRQDITHHPFMIKFSLGDVRITTRVREHYLNETLFSTIHECGHALYEQGIRMDLEGTPLANGTSAGVHESQSRLWENPVGRSRSFWEYFYPELQAVFSEQLSSVSLDTFYRAINKVERSLIRTDADEVTYNLHVMIRFDLELEMLEGQLAIKDLPDAWDARYQSDLGIHSPELNDGVLQDVHWYSGFIGGSFQGYTLGNIMGAHFFEKAQQANPSIISDIRRGEFGDLRSWLTQNIYQYGSMFTPDELVKRVTGGPITIEPYIRYLQTKYGELYSL